MAVFTGLGSNTAPSFTFSSDTNTGIYSPGADQVAISTGGTQRINIEADGDINIDSGGVFYDATNNRLGVGTTSPTSLLTLRSDSASAVTAIRLENLNASGGVTTQSVGISAVFDYNNGGSVATAGSITFGKEGTYTTSVAEVDSYLGFGTALNNVTTEKCRITSDGKLLVGTSSARSDFFNANTVAPVFQVQGTGNYRIASITAVDTSSQSGAGLILAKSRSTGNTIVQSGDYLGSISFQGSDGVELVEGAAIEAVVDGTPGSNDLPTRLVFSTTADGASSPTERMRINSNGVVSITNGRLYVQESDASNPLCYAYNTNNASTDVAYRSELGVGSNGTSAYHFYAVTGGSGKFAIYGNGTYGTISDQRLKAHIETARNGYLDDLNRLNIVKYGWKTDGLDQATELGVIAQEVEQVFPGLIQETPPNEEGEIYKGVKTSVFTFMLIKALQEASAKIETLEAKVAALESA